MAQITNQLSNQTPTENVLVLGAGLVTRPGVRYLLEHGYGVTVASRTAEKAAAIVDGHAAGRALAWTTGDLEGLRALVAKHDLVLSLLPAQYHPEVARACIAGGKHMVTTSYISPEMRALDSEARGKDLILLNEIGVDPGIDHMSIMRVIDRVRQRGGRITALRSLCGGLPAPEANNNPLGYKLSWSPAGVLVAMTGPALFRADGRTVDCPPGTLFAQVQRTTVAEIGELEFYPNRDSLSYIDVYGLGDIDTMYRGTFRYPGWAALWQALWRIGVLDRSPRPDLADTTFAAAMAELVGAASDGELRAAVAEASGASASASSSPMAAIEWLGLLGDTPMGDGGSWLDCVSDLLQRKLAFAPRERDMLIMQHTFAARYPGGDTEHITSTMLEFGQPNGDSAMARTVSLPAAIAIRLILQGHIPNRGVCAPVTADIYRPVLAELESLGIGLEEHYGPAQD